MDLILLHSLFIFLGVQACFFLTALFNHLCVIDKKLQLSTIRVHLPKKEKKRTRINGWNLIQTNLLGDLSFTGLAACK